MVWRAKANSAAEDQRHAPLVGALLPEGRPVGGQSSPSRAATSGGTAGGAAAGGGMLGHGAILLRELRTQAPATLAEGTPSLSKCAKVQPGRSIG